MTLIVRNARAYPTWKREHLLVDVVAEEDGIVSVSPAGASRPAFRGRSLVELDAEGRFLSPPLVDAHVHLDAAMILPQLPENVTGSLWEAIDLWNRAKGSFTIDSVKRRAREAVLWEVAQGTGFIRSHVDVWDPSLIAVKALIELRDEVRDIVDLELIAFPQNGVISLPEGQNLMREAMSLGCDVVGGIPHNEWTYEDGVEEVRFIFDLANRHGVPVDLHCDETDDEQSRFLEHVVAETLRRGMEGRVVASHTTAMGSYNDAYTAKLFRLLRLAGVTIVANPLDNIVLQGRFDTYPKRRGMTRVKELDAAGINVGCGHDSIVDMCYPLGKGSMLDALSMLVHVGQMTLLDELRRSYRMVTVNPARASGRDWTIDEGKPSNFVVLDCSDEVEAIRLRPAARWVVRHGVVIAETEPSQTRMLLPGWEQDVTLELRPDSHGDLDKGATPT